MFNIADDLGRASCVYAVPGDFTFNMFNLSTANRAFFWRRIYLFISRAHIHHRSNYIRDHITCALYQHAICDADILIIYVVKIMQGGLFHDHPTDFNRLQDRVWCQHSRAPDVHTNVQELGGDLNSRELISNRPARVFPNHTQISCECEIVDFNHHPIYF